MLGDLILLGIFIVTDLYPARMFMSVDFPAPEGPIIATSSPLLNFPEIPFKRVL